MSTIDQAFVKQFEREVHESYQRLGSKLRHTVRTKSNVIGATTTFQKVGKGTAATKARHGMVPVMNLDHEPVECVLTDYYAGDWIDRLDELKVNLDERQVIANAGAYALGRKSDELIIDALASVTGDQTVAVGSTGLTKQKVLEAYARLNQADVPDDGQRFAIVGPAQWSDLLLIQEFADASFVGPEGMAWRGTQAKVWLGAHWLYHSGLPIAADTRSCFWYHRSAIAHAVGADVTTDVTWHGDRAAYFVANFMSQGAALIDAAGVVRIECLEA